MPARSMKRTILAAVFIVAASLCTGAVAQSSSSCTNVLISMSPCLDYIQGNSSKPPSSCCSQLANVVRSEPRCLCQVLNGGASSLGVSVNQTQAMALPTACNVKTPPASQCNASSPSGSPSGTSTPPSSGGGSKTVPTTDNAASGGNSSTKLSLTLLFFLIFITAQASSSFIAI